LHCVHDNSPVEIAVQLSATHNILIARFKFSIPHG